MIKFIKEICDGKYYIFEDTSVIVNNKGIMDDQGKIIIKPKYSFIGDFQMGYAVCYREFNVYLNPEVYWGLLDSDLNEVIDAVKAEHFGNVGFLEVRNIMLKSILNDNAKKEKSIQKSLN